MLTIKDHQMQCCGSNHLFDSGKVRINWWPKDNRCFIIGESPGRPGSSYFYDPMPQYAPDPIAVRRYLLSALVEARLIVSPTLEAFRDGGFLFDHAIRCQLDLNTIRVERKMAEEYQSDLAHQAKHLKPIIDQFPKVWVMGYIARDAVSYLISLSNNNYALWKEINSPI